MMLLLQQGFQVGKTLSLGLLSMSHQILTGKLSHSFITSVLLTVAGAVFEG